MPFIHYVTVGDEGAGKTSLCTTYSKGAFPAEHMATGVNRLCTTDSNGHSVVDVKLSDTGGSDAYKTQRLQEYANADVILICFSVVDPKSFENVRTRWLPEVSKPCKGALKFLIGTKMDLRDNKMKMAPITHGQGESLAKEVGALKYFECSAFNKQGIDSIFRKIIDIAVPWKQAKSDAARE